MDDSTLKVGSNEKSEVSIGEGGLKPIDIPVPIFPKRTASVPNIGANSQSSTASNRIFQTFQTKADWRLFLTVEERQLIRRKIRQAYENRTQSYEELLQTCAAIEEELVFISAPSRLDYFKTGMQFEKRVTEKRKHLTDGPVSSSGQFDNVFSPGKPPMKAINEQTKESEESQSDSDNDSTPRNNKRQKVDI